jgi:orotate phosphoribosyltransferase-like protein
MKIQIAIECDNAAFEGNECGSEVARILHRIANRIDGLERACMVLVDGSGVMDVNGNPVAKVSVEGS